jgi:hypothetical protein
VELFSATLCARVLFSSLSFLLFFPSYVSAELTAPTSDSRRVVRGPALCVVTPHRVDARAQAGVMPEDPGWGFAGDHEDRAADDREAVLAAHPLPRAGPAYGPAFRRFLFSCDLPPSPGVHSAPWEKCKAAMSRCCIIRFQAGLSHGRSSPRYRGSLRLGA